MSDHHAEPRRIAPLFSVIIPLEYHRGQWERCWQGWQSQTLDRDSFEIILVVPPDFPERGKLRELADPAPRLEYSQHSHDIALSADGAAAARGKFLFFTESHCWPEPDVLERCLQAFFANADWAGFSCKSLRVCPNRLSEAEADMYEADTDYGMIVHPWRKILDVCFATRREAYEECAGFRPEFGHFSEWALAASYFARGHTVGYLPEARMHHYYIGAFAELKAFTRDFVEGEIRYFSQKLREPGATLEEAPSELFCQGNFDRDMARGIFRMAMQDAIASRVAGGRCRQAMFAVGRWASPAIFGDGVARHASAAVTLYAYLVALLALVSGSRQWLSVRFRLFIAALIRHQRLRCIRTERQSSATAGMPGATIGSDTNAAVLDQTGFYPFEKYQGSQFRWSENAAAIRLRADAGRQSIHIKCLPVRDLSEMDARFFVDGRRIPDHDIATGVDDFEIRIDLPPSGTCKLGWICRPFQAKADPRRLGLPIARIELASAAGRAQPADVNSLSLQA
ncbi:MAG TPA: hypothetical protein VF957_15430 [Bradyrhizobium sp.]